MEVFWHHIFFYIYHKIDFFIQTNQVYFSISQNRFCDIKNRFAYIKFDFVISQSGVFYVHTGLFQDFINNITSFDCQKTKAQA